MIGNLIGLKLKIFGNPFPGWKGWRTFFNRAKKQAYYDAGAVWQMEIRPEHFTLRAAARYGYAPRGGEGGKPDPYGFFRSYTGRKQKKWGHRRPLEWCGRSRRATRLARITSSRRHVRLVVDAGRLGYRPHPASPDMEEELGTLDQRDAKRLAEAWAASMEESLAKLKSVETIAA